MPNIKVYNSSGEVENEISLQAKESSMNSALISEVVRFYRNGVRKNYAHTKDRREVRGGGRKPWRQKGTGRARHGSSRSPIWRGGGITFGPRKDKKFSFKLNKKQLQKAFRDIFNAKVENDEIKIIKSFGAIEKTKEIYKLIKVIIDSSGLEKIKFSALVIYDKGEPYKTLSNIPEIEISSLDSVNVLDLMKKKYIIMSESVYGKLEKRI